MSECVKCFTFNKNIDSELGVTGAHGEAVEWLAEVFAGTY